MAGLPHKTDLARHVSLVGLWPGTEIGLQILTGSFLGWRHNAESSRAELYLRRSSTKAGGVNLDRSGPWPTLSIRFFRF